METLVRDSASMVWGGGSGVAPFRCRLEQNERLQTHRGKNVRDGSLCASESQLSGSSSLHAKMSGNKLETVVEKECCPSRPSLSQKLVAHNACEEKREDRGIPIEQTTQEGKHGCSGPWTQCGFRGYAWRQGGMSCDWTRCISPGAFLPLLA